MQTYNKPYPIERILSCATYLTVGGVGFVWLIIAAFLRNNWQKEAKEILFNGKLLSEAYINEKELLTLWNNHQEQKRDYSYQLFSLLNLSIFLENNK